MRVPSIDWRSWTARKVLRVVSEKFRVLIYFGFCSCGDDYSAADWKNLNVRSEKRGGTFNAIGRSATSARVLNDQKVFCDQTQFMNSCSAAKHVCECRESMFSSSFSTSLAVLRYSYIYYTGLDTVVCTRSEQERAI